MNMCVIDRISMEYFFYVVRVMINQHQLICLMLHQGKTINLTNGIQFFEVCVSLGRNELINPVPAGSPYIYRADSRFVPSQWETTLLCNDVSHWLGASLESTLHMHKQFQEDIGDLFYQGSQLEARFS